MLRLRSGIQVCADIEPRPDTVTLSSGTFPVAARFYNGQEFGNAAFEGGQAFLPLDPWHSPDSEEKSLLWAHPSALDVDKQARGEWIRLLRVPRDILDILIALGFPAVSSAESYRAIVDNPGYNEALSAIGDYFKQYTSILSGRGGNGAENRVYLAHVGGH